MLAFALLPTVSRALAFAHDDARFVEVCTAAGVKLKLLGDADLDAPGSGSHEGGEGVRMGGPLEHCAYCAHAPGAAPLAAQAARLPEPGAITTAPPARGSPAPGLRQAWLRSPPRGPPLR